MHSLEINKINDDMEIVVLYYIILGLIPLIITFYEYLQTILE